MVLPNNSLKPTEANMVSSRIIRNYFRFMIRNLGFVFIGCILFLLKRHYSGPLEDIIHSYGGNFFVSFALYFVFLNPFLQVKLRVKKVLAALLTLALVESFEAFNGFGYMINTYDPVDYIANALGVVFAIGLDVILSRKSKPAMKTKAS